MFAAHAGAVVHPGASHAVLDPVPIVELQPTGDVGDDGSVDGTVDDGDDDAPATTTTTIKKTTPTTKVVKVDSPAPTPAPADQPAISTLDIIKLGAKGSTTTTAAPTTTTTAKPGANPSPGAKASPVRPTGAAPVSTARPVGATPINGGQLATTGAMSDFLTALAMLFLAIGIGLLSMKAAIVKFD